jgi:riboflavin synthase
VSAAKVLADLEKGASLALNGVCLTVADLSSFEVKLEAVAQTLEVTTLGCLQVGVRVNLERSLRLSDRLGGHLVQGHVDGVGRVSKIRYLEGSTLITIELNPGQMKLMAPHGSVTVDGVSLTIAQKSSKSITISLIPTTLENTTLGELRPGSKVNIESDIIIRWLADRFKDGEVTTSEGANAPEWGEFHLED